MLNQKCSGDSTSGSSPIKATWGTAPLSILIESQFRYAENTLIHRYAQSHI